MREVGGGNDGEVTEIGLEEQLGRGEGFDGCIGGRTFGLELGETRLKGIGIIVCNACDDNIVQGEQIADVFHAHHTDANYSISDGGRDLNRHG